MIISKTAVNTTNFKKNIQFTNAAREGWLQILKTLKKEDKVLLPSYIGETKREGSGIYDPIISSKLRHDFYNLNKDLSISIEIIEECLKKEKYSLILLVHYFGFKIQNIQKITALCKEYNVIVVEDCAHLYTYNINNYSDAGTFGDYVFYSLHKFFPFKSGGLFVQNNLNLKSPNKAQDTLLQDYSNNLVTYNIQEIVNKRIDNFKTMDVLIKKVKGITPLKKINQGDIPHNYPILVDNGLREKLYFWLIKNDITLIALYYKLITPITFEEYKPMHAISNNILNLPIHQDMNKKEIMHLVKMLEKGIITLS